MTFGKLRCALACAGLAGACSSTLRPSPETPWSARFPATAPASAAQPSAQPAPLSQPLPAFTHALPRAAGSSPGPVTFEAAAANGSWVVLCQARSDTNGDGQLAVSVSATGGLEGDVLQRYFVTADGAEQVIEDWLAASADGRYVALRRGGVNWLLDLESDAQWSLDELGADTRREAGSGRLHRALVFDGSVLLYVRSDREQSEVVEREVASGAERVIHRSREPVVRVEVEPQRRTRVVSVVAEDANKNGRWDLPLEPASETAPCRTPQQRYRATPPTSDRVGYFVIDAVTARSLRVDDLVLPFGHSVLRRGVDNALWLERPGQRVLLEPGSCASRVLWADPAREQLLLGCALPQRATRLAVESLARGQRRPLGIDVAALEFDEPVQASQRLIALYPGADSVLFDADRQKLHRLRPRDAVLASWNQRALLRRDAKLWLFDADLETESELAAELDPLAEVLTQGPLVWAAPWVVDLSRAQALGSVPGRALALTTTASVLMPVQAATSTRLAEGPLTWHEPLAP